MRQTAATPVLRGLLYMIVILFVGSFMTALLLQYTPIPEERLPYFTYGIHLIGTLTGGFAAGRNAEGKGWIYGGITGLLYALLLSLVAFLAFDQGFTTRTLAMLLGAFASSAIGGIFGVNWNRK
ncbi:MAG: TIGR04086 family membrane protein [Thermicanus sp.]|nr:TIGR04086 family membrane protein [Thermicanus sp.]